MTQPDASVQPADLIGYLESRGWQRDGTYRGADVWRFESAGRLLIPDTLEYDDDSDLVTDAIRRLAAYEERPAREVVRDIAEPMVDIQYYRLFPDASPGLIPLPSGMKAVTGIHDLLAAAARRVHEGPRLFFEGRRAARVEDFLRDVLLGSAVPGSYILTARIPLGQPWQPELDLEDRPIPITGQPLPSRQVALQLRDAVKAAQAAAQRVIQGERMDGFYEAVDQGVSANLCRALADLGGARRDSRFDIGFTWARGLPATSPGLAAADRSEPVRFSGSMAAVLASAGHELEQLAKSGRAHIIGQVETLYFSEGEQPRIKIVGDLRHQAGDQLARRSLWVAVTMTQYDRAYEAQRRGWTLEVEGQLHINQRRLELRPTRFEVLPVR